MKAFELTKNEDIVFANRVLQAAPHFRTMEDLSRHFETTAFRMRYKLGKARKLDEVKKILSGEKDMSALAYNGHTIHHNKETSVFTVLLMKSPGIVERTVQAKSLRAAQMIVTKYNSEI